MSMFPAGKYYIGDLCYAIADEEWDDFCDLTISGERVLDGEFRWKNGVLYTHHTAHGDGVYADNFGRMYGVDAGLIGLLPADLVNKHEYGNFEGDGDLGHIIEFTEPFECSYEDGTFYFGDIVIHTGYMDYEENANEE